MVLYVIVRNYMGHLKSFFCSLLIIFQLTFLYWMSDAIRAGIAILFVGLAVLTMVDREITRLHKVSLFTIFCVSAIVSHYSTGYTLAIWIVLLFIFMHLFRLFVEKNLLRSKQINSSVITIGMSILLIVIIFTWYSLVTAVPFNVGIVFIRKTFENLITFGSLEMRQETIGKMFGFTVESIPSLITVLSHDLIFLCITIGVFSLLKNFKQYQGKGFPIEYLLSAFIFFTMLVALIVIPYVSKYYDAGRPFVTSLFFLAPVFIIGVEAICKAIRLVKLSLLFVCLILIVQYAVVLFLPYHIIGKPVSPYYEALGEGRNEFYIYDGEIASAVWLQKYGIRNSIVRTDWRTPRRLMLAWGSKSNFIVGFISGDIFNKDIGKVFFYYTSNSVSTGDYIYLRDVNVSQQKIFKDINETVPLNEFSILLDNSNKVYSNINSYIYIK